MKQKKAKSQQLTVSTTENANTESQQLTVSTIENANTGYISIPQEMRFLVLYQFMKRNQNTKVIVYVSSHSFVQFCEEFMQVEGLSLLTIHEKQEKSLRKKNFQQFYQTSSGILVCTAKAIKNVGKPKANFMVQFDPPHDINEYIERLNRMNTLGNCQCLLFTIEEEMEFIRYLKSHNVQCELIDVSFSKLNNVQNKLERLVKEKYALYLSARQAYAAYVKTYRDLPNKEIFSFSNINLTKVGKTFGFRVPPFVDISSPQPDQEENNQNGARVEDKKSRTLKKIKRFYKPVKVFESKT